MVRVRTKLLDADEFKLILFKCAVSTNEVMKRGGAGKVNWGRPGDELVDTFLDEHDPAYDSADELFETAFGSRSRNTQYDWSGLAGLTDEDSEAMDEIEIAMREEWIERADQEQAEVEEEGQAFFTEPTITAT